MAKYLNLTLKDGRVVSVELDENLKVVNAPLQFHTMDGCHYTLLIQFAHQKYGPLKEVTYNERKANAG